MSKILYFSPNPKDSAQQRLNEFIRQCRYELTVFGSDLNWDDNYWVSAGVTFGGMDQTTRKLRTENTMQEPFLSFAKAYFRYEHGIRPSRGRADLAALKCLERALVLSAGVPDILNINSFVLDEAAVLARTTYSPSRAYNIGRELRKLADFVSEKGLVPTDLCWKSPIPHPLDPIRTGAKAKKIIEEKMPDMEALHALAAVFAKNPTAYRDIFTSSVMAMTLCAPSRISELLALSVDCEVTQTNREGQEVYGWRFHPGKGAEPMIKWIPDVMAPLAKEAIRRVRAMTTEARKIALWIEEHPDRLYTHGGCPKVDQDQPLSVDDAASAMGLWLNLHSYRRSGLLQVGLSGAEGGNTLRDLNRVAMKRLPKDFPWFDRGRNLKFSDALFCLQERQLRADREPNPVMVWRPDANVVNSDLCTRVTNPGVYTMSIFDRHGFNDGRVSPLKATTHQFRHMLNTMAQRGGLSQSEIARWSGRSDVKQNRVYDHMSEFELVAMLRSHDPALSLDRPLQEIAEQISSHIPMTRQEFNSLAIPTAHITEFGFCVHDFVMSPCQRFRDCLNCTEQVCIKGDKRLVRIKEQLVQVRDLVARAEKEIADGTAGADRWYEIHSMTEKRLVELIRILENPAIADGAIVRLHNKNEFSPLRRAIESKALAGNMLDSDREALSEFRGLLGDKYGSSSD